MGRHLRILCCVCEEYYGLPGSKSSGYEFFVNTFTRMGNHVDHYDFMAKHRTKEQINDTFIRLVRGNAYDLVFFETNEDEIFPEILDEARKHAVTLAWNSDDDVRWKNYSSLWASYYTYAVTTCRSIYEQNRHSYPNLLLSQWGCTGIQEGIDAPKDIIFSFVGQVYSSRKRDIERLVKDTKIKIFGKNWPPPGNARLFLKQVAHKLGLPFPEKKGTALSTQEEVKSIWNRSKMSFTPLEAYDGHNLQIKARVFDMGLSGTVMLCNKNLELRNYYEPEKEFFEYDDISECIRLFKWLQAHENTRRKVAEAYYRRTKGEHLLEHRFRKLFDDIGLM